MSSLVGFVFLASCCQLTFLTAAMPTPDIGDFPAQMQTDSYATIPKLEQNPGDTGLNLDIAPPSTIMESGPPMYYMNSDGLAEPAEAQRRKREALPAADAENESLLTAETVIIGPPSGNRPFGTPAIHLGYRPARAYYARRYHKYPWNYH